MARPQTATRLKIILAATLLFAHAIARSAAAQGRVAVSAADPRPAVTVPAPPVPGHLTHYVAPVYPRQAREEHIKGTVSLNVTVAPNGSVSSVVVASAPPLLGQAAAAAVQHWTYTPWRVGREPVEGHLTVHIDF